MLDAAYQGNTDEVQRLIRQGADVNAKDSVGWIALHYAASNGRQATAQLLLDNGARVDAEGDNGETPLHRAALYGHQATVRLLLDNGAHVEAKAKNGKTALHCAAINDHQATVRVLLDNGARVDVMDKYGKTALDYAKSDAMRHILTTHQQQPDAAAKKKAEAEAAATKKKAEDDAAAAKKKAAEADAAKKKAEAELMEQLKKATEREKRIEELEHQLQQKEEVKKEDKEQRPQPQHPRKTTDFTTDFASPLGAGSQGAVFKGSDKVTKKTVAVKVQQGGNLDAEFIILAMLKHPNIVEVLHFDNGAGDAGLQSSKIFMEFVDAGSLDNRISPAAPLSEEEIRRYLSSLLQALAYIHAQQPPVWHRDIKPANMLLTKDGTIKLTDFGCSKVRGKTGQTMTAAAGTWVYMAPEACEGKPCAASDLWSLACSVVEMASGKKPWHETGLKDFPLGTHISKPNPPLNHYPTVPQALSAPLQALLRKMFAHNPEHRGTAASHLKDTYFTNEIPSPAPTAGGGGSAVASAFPQWLLALPVSDAVRTILVQNEIDEISLMLLNSEDIVGMGIALGPRRVLLNEIAKQNKA